MQRDRFQDYHPAIQFLFFIAAIVFSMCFVHPAFVVCSVFFSACYLVMLRGRKAWKVIADEDGLENIEALFNPTLGCSDEEITTIFKEVYGYDDFPGFSRRSYDYVLSHLPGGCLPLREGAREILEERLEKLKG